MSPSPGPGNSDRFRQYLENLGRDIEPDSGFFSPDTVFWRVSREPALLLAEEKEQFYQQAKRFRQLFGIPEQRYPDSWANFQNWWQRTRDWVVIVFYDDQHHEGQHTVVTEIRGPLTGRRIVRGRESECLAHYAHESPATTGKA